MRDIKAFIDTNVLIYMFTEDEPEKRISAGNALNNSIPIISTQVIREIANVFMTKKKNNGLETMEKINDILETIDLSYEKVEHIQKAIYIKEKYKLSFYDSLILASAIKENCDVVYSEDMQDGQVIEGVKIINPFNNNCLK